MTGLRGLAVAVVIAAHASYLLLPEQYGRYLIPGGFIGVDAFFVLSGFLITSLLLDEYAKGGRISVRAFYLRRLLRLFPALLVVVAAVMAIDLVLYNQGAGRVALTGVVSIFYVTNWFTTFSGGDIDHSLGHLWSLAVEEQYYFVWPAVVVGLLAARWNRSRWTAVLLVGIGLSVLAKAGTWLLTGDWALIYFRTDARIDALLIGALLATWCHSGADLTRLRPFFWPACAVLVVALAVSKPQQGWVYLGGYTLVALAVAALIAALLTDSGAARPRFRAALSNRPLLHVGEISYGLYLWHIPVFYLVRENLAFGLAVNGLVALGVTIVLAELSWHLVEQPFLRMKRRVSVRAQALDTVHVSAT